MVWLKAGLGLGAVIVAGLIYAKGHSDGDTKRTLADLRGQIVAERKVRKREAELQDQVDDASEALARMAAQLAAARKGDDNKRNVFYVQNPAAAAAVCLSGGRLVHHREADAAAAAALAAGAGDDRVLDHAGAVPKR